MERVASAIEGRLPDLGLHDLVKSCGDGLPEADDHHASTRQLFPLLLKLTSRRVFESAPERLLATGVWDTIPAGSRGGLLGRRMLQFDALADYLQRRHNTRLKAACIGALGFICGFDVFAHLGEEPAAIRSALLLLGAAFTVVFLLKSRTVQMAYLSTRAIAEILRIQFFMEAAGCPIPAHEWVPRRYKPVFGRVLAVVERVQGETEGMPTFSLSPEEVRDAWFVGQTRYFGKAAARERSFAKLWETTSSWAFSIAILSMIVLASGYFASGSKTPWDRYLLVAGPSLLGVAAVCQFYLERRGFKPNAERYCHSVHIYDVKADEDWAVVVRDVGAEALHEIVDWYVASVEREIGVPR